VSARVIPLVVVVIRRRVVPPAAPAVTAVTAVVAPVAAFSLAVSLAVAVPLELAVGVTAPAFCLLRVDGVLGAGRVVRVVRRVYRSVLPCLSAPLDS
jgi:hypothetical protein